LADQIVGAPVVHFIQRCDGPVFTSIGNGVLECRCGNRLIDGYDPARFIDISLQCGHCGAVTTTPPLADVRMPPPAVVVAEPVAEPRNTTTALGETVFAISRSEMERLTTLYQPRTPDWTYTVTEDLLDETLATFARVNARPLPAADPDPGQPLAGLKDHALAWAVGHLRARMRQGAWRADDGIATPIAVTTVTGFLHFVATWSHHPLFPAMVTGAAESGFAAHGLAPFAAAHCATMMGNRVSFPAPVGVPPRVAGFNLATGPVGIVEVQLEVFNRFEVPFGQTWTPLTLRSAVADSLAACASRINPRNHGLLLISPGTALAGFDEALIQAIKEVLHRQGRRHRGLMAVAPIVLRLQQMQDPHAVRLCYGFFPIANRHYAGDTALQVGA
jgi:hypothetical protein